MVNLEPILEEWEYYLSNEVLMYYKFELDVHDRQGFYDTTVTEFCEKNGYSTKTLEQIFSDWRFKDAFFKEIEKDESYTFIEGD